MAMFLIMKCKLIEDTLDQFRLMHRFDELHNGTFYNKFLTHNLSIPPPPLFPFFRIYFLE